MNVLDLFSGIGGFSLGLERAGFKTIAFCEIDKNARKVLRKHWPTTPIFEDVRNLKASDVPGKVDLICGGFPCQDISVAGKGVGLEGARSGLWKEFHRLIKEIKPRYVIIENVANLRSKGLSQVLKALWKIGYDSEWHCIPASSLGAPHIRDRVWIIAHSNVPELRFESGRWNGESREEKNSSREDGQTTSHTNHERLQRFIEHEISQLRSDEPNYTEFGDRVVPSFGQFRNWYSQSLRSSDGVPERLDKNRLSLCGNAVIPQIPEIIGKAILNNHTTKGDQ